MKLVPDFPNVIANQFLQFFSWIDINSKYRAALKKKQIFPTEKKKSTEATKYKQMKVKDMFSEPVEGSNQKLKDIKERLERCVS